MVNIWIGTGRVTKDATLAKTTSGKSVCKFTIACQRDNKDADGNRKTDFIEVVTWNALAEFCARQLRKGKIATIVGCLQMRDYEDKDGNKRRAWEIIAQKVNITEWEDDGELPWENGNE